MSLTPAERDYVEQMAQKRFQYGRIFAEHRQILMKDQPKYEEAIAKVRQSSLVAKPGQRWQPPEDQADEYIAKNDELCHSVPCNIEELVSYNSSKGSF